MPASTSDALKAAVVCTIFRLLVTFLRCCGLTRFAARLCCNVPLGAEAPSPPSTELVVLSLLLAVNATISDLILTRVPTRIGARLWRSDVSSLRAILAAMPQTGPFAHLPPAPVDYVDVSCPATESVWFHRPVAGHSSAAVVMYIHGGGYIAGSAVTFDIFATMLSHALRTATGSPTPIPILSYAYPLGPEAAISEQVDLGFQTYAWLARTVRDGADAAGAVRPPRLVLVGDSAGGGIAALLAQRLAAAANSSAARTRDATLPAPACLVLVSPSLELRSAGGSVTANAHRDVMLCPAAFRLLLAVLEANPKHTEPPARLHAPCFSAIHGSWAGLPPVFAWAAESEALADDAARAAAAVRAAGGHVEEEMVPHAFHEMPVWAHAVPEGADALERIAQFVHRSLQGNFERE